MAADGSDNPILDMGLLGMMTPNPYIDPAYAGKPLKLQGFRGPATDAYGKVIGGSAPPPGTTTLNTPGPGAVAGPGPAAPANGQPAGGTINYAAMGSAGPPLQELMSNYQATQAAKTPQQLYNEQQSNLYRQQTMGQMNDAAAAKAATGGFGNSQGGAFNPGQAVSPLSLAAMSGPAPTAAPAAAAPANGPAPFDARQAYLDKLANPGPPTRVGAAVPASTPLGTPSVLNAFMAAHPGGGAKGAGGYDNSGFFSTLSNLRNA